MALECAICFETLLPPRNDDNDENDEDYVDADDEYDDFEDEYDEDAPNRGPDRTPVLTQCGHMYHSHCLAAWLVAPGNERKRSCPQCRERVYSRDLLRMDLEGQYDDTEENQRKSGHVPKKVGKESQHSGNGQCFDRVAHEKLAKDYETLLKTEQEKRDQLALILGEKASLQANLNPRENIIEQQQERGSKRKWEDSDQSGKRQCTQQ